jgi:hypothetical protein
MTTDSPYNTVTFLKALRVRPYFIHLASHIATENGGPLLNEDSRVLHMAVEWVNGDRSILDYEFTGACGWQWRGIHFQWSTGFDEPCCLIRRCCHSLVLYFLASCLLFSFYLKEKPPGDREFGAGIDAFKEGL